MARKYSSELIPQHFFDLSKCPYSVIFNDTKFAWDALKRLEEYIDDNLNGRYGPCIPDDLNHLVAVGKRVYVGPKTVIEPGAVIKGPAIIGSQCTIRAGAYIRENVLIGNAAVIGHSTELKHCILFDEVQVPHFNYVGDSILGWKAHLGAGVKISNVKITDRNTIEVEVDGRVYDTGLGKFGAILGDFVEIGCNSVLNPGTVIGKQTLAYANLSMSGYYPANTIVKLRQSQEITARRFDSSID